MKQTKDSARPVAATSTPAEHSPLAAWTERVGAGQALVALAELDHDAAVFAVDEQQRILYWSPGAEALLGYRAADVVGAHCLTANRCQACMSGCGIAEHRRVSDVPLTLHQADGAPIQLTKSGRAFFDDDGRFLGGVERLSPRPSAPPAPLHEPTWSSKVTTFHGLVSRDEAMLRAFQTVRNVAETDATVLLRGASGTGKELVARAIHAESHRSAGAFVAVNCAALTPTLIESELFGHKKGAFTGAAADRAGLFQQAHHGTIFLDEVAELSMEVQAKLLRVLEEREVTPVGANRPVAVDVRVVAATHRSLRQAVRAGRFREDLMYRLRVVPLYLPALRQRSDDIELLLWHFIARRNQRGPRLVSEIAPEAMRALLHHSWPGNIRELRNVVEYAFAVGRGPILALGELPPEFRQRVADAAGEAHTGELAAVARAPAAAAPTVPAPASVGAASAAAPAINDLRGPSDAQERAAIAAAIAASDGHLGDAAARLGISRPTLWRKRKKYGL